MKIPFPFPGISRIARSRPNIRTPLWGVLFHGSEAKGMRVAAARGFPNIMAVRSGRHEILGIPFHFLFLGKLLRRKTRGEAAFHQERFKIEGDPTRNEKGQTLLRIGGVGGSGSIS